MKYISGDAIESFYAGLLKDTAVGKDPEVRRKFDDGTAQELVRSGAGMVRSQELWRHEEDIITGTARQEPGDKQCKSIA